VSVDLATDALVVLTFAVAAGALAQAVTGLGFSLVCAPVMVLVLGPAIGVRLAHMCSVAVSTVGLVTHRAHVDVRAALGLLVPAIVITPLVVTIVHRTSTDTLSVVAGALTVLSVAALASGFRAPQLRGRGGAVIAGCVSATMNVMSGLSGPAVAMYGVNAEWEPDRMRGTFQLYFLALNIVAVIALGPLRIGLTRALVLLAAIAIGFTTGHLLGRRLPAQTVRMLVLLVAGAGGIAAIIRGLT
jgi:uncharacterized membrane protein YfcA